VEEDELDTGMEGARVGTTNPSYVSIPRIHPAYLHL
jgi:hypothetical protein